MAPVWFWSLQQVCVRLAGGSAFDATSEDKSVSHLVSVCVLHVACYAYVPGCSARGRMRCAVLNAGLHHSCRLQRGGCNPIPLVGAVVQPAKRKRALLCALTLLFLHSSPFLPSITLFLPLICSLPARRRTSLRNRRSALFTHRPSPFKSTWYDGAFPPLSFFYYFFFSFPLSMSLPVESTACTPVRWRARACSHQSQRRIYLRVDCPHTVRAISPPRKQVWTSPIVTEKQRKKGGNTPDYKDGVLRHFKDDFLQSE